jgi:hypothetical protein
MRARADGAALLQDCRRVAAAESVRQVWEPIGLLTATVSAWECVNGFGDATGNR